jgi:glycosyltransferase involved in cell wall biosynthesis
MLTRSQIRDVLELQASWVVRTLRADLAASTFPFPAFFSLCMPAYNEQGNIEDTLDAACTVLPHFVTTFEVVVVDDGSRDATADLVARYSGLDARVRLVQHEHNRGYGAAVTTALRAARGDLVAFTDSDGQFSFLDLPQFLTCLNDHDVVIGYRHQRADSRLRLFNAWGWNWVIRLALGVWVKDLDCAFKVFRREVLDQLHLTSAGATINAEILAQCFRRGVRIREIPVTHWPRCAGQPTGAALKVIWKAFRELPRMWKYRYPIMPAPAVNGHRETLVPAPATEPEAA